MKSTQFGDKNVFQVSWQEWEFITTLPRVKYDIYRVYHAGDGNKARIVKYPDVFNLMLERKIQLCLAV